MSSGLWFLHRRRRNRPRTLPNEQDGPRAQRNTVIHGQLRPASPQNQLPQPKQQNQQQQQHLPASNHELPSNSWNRDIFVPANVTKTTSPAPTNATVDVFFMTEGLEEKIDSAFANRIPHEIVVYHSEAYLYGKQGDKKPTAGMGEQGQVGGVCRRRRNSDLSALTDVTAVLMLPPRVMMQQAKPLPDPWLSEDDDEN